MSTKTRVSYEQFDEMIRRGDFAESEDRYELLFGEIVVMPLPDPPHEDLVDELAEWSIRALPEGVIRVRVQNTLGIPELDSVTMPDVAWMRRRDYSKKRPLAEDVLLVIEVADSTLSKDRNKKARLYAQAGISEYWIVNVTGRRLEVRRNPEGKLYQYIEIFEPGQEVHPLAFPDVSLPISRLFPE